MNTKYSTLELMFSNRWQWVRKLSRHLWVKGNHKDDIWVKYTEADIEIISRLYSNSNNMFKNYITEDWRKSRLFRKAGA